MDSFNSKLTTSLSFNKYRNNRIRKIKSPFLSGLLKSENVPFDFHYQPVEIKTTEHYKTQHLMPFDQPIFRNTEHVSYDRDDYFTVQVEAAMDMEKSAVDNSMFLAISRALLYKIFFFDDKYEFILRKTISHYLPKCETDNFFSSDIIFQQYLRKLLCAYWLSFVENGELKPNSKYSDMFCNVLEFIFQIYQISINNFSNNKLFKRYALEDLSIVFNLKIIVFNGEDGNFYPKNKKFKVCESFETKKLHINDSVFLEKVGQLEYQWLMPITKRAFFNSIFIPGEINFYYFRVSDFYSNKSILIEANQIKKAFGKKLKSNQNLILFEKFLSELAVHSLISLEKIDFDLLLNCSDKDKIINYLNDLWGKQHFSLKKVLNEIEPNRQIKLTCLERKKEINSQCDIDTSFCDINKYNELMLNSSSILKFSIENLLNDVDSIKDFEIKKSRKKVYEYFQEKQAIQLKTMCSLPKKCQYFDCLNSTVNDLNESLQDNLLKNSPEEKLNLSECNLSMDKSKSKAVMFKKKSLDTCLNTLMKLSSSPSSEK